MDNVFKVADYAFIKNIKCLFIKKAKNYFYPPPIKSTQQKNPSTSKSSVF